MYCSLPSASAADTCKKARLQCSLAFLRFRICSTGHLGDTSCVSNTPLMGGSFFLHRLSGVLELRKRVRP